MHGHMNVKFVLVHLQKLLKHEVLNDISASVLRYEDIDNKAGRAVCKAVTSEQIKGSCGNA